MMALTAVLALFSETRIAGSTSNMAWTDILNVCDNSFICDHGQENTDDYVLTVPTGQEMRIAYNCPGNGNCYAYENHVVISKINPSLQFAGATATGVTGSPTG